jgi:hypothetical protein
MLSDGAYFSPMASASMVKALGSRSAQRFVVFAFCAVLSFPLATFAADHRRAFSSFQIEVGSRTGFFPSPAYTVSITGTGRVSYRGYDRVHWKGKRHAHISESAVTQLVEDVRASNFFDLPRSYDNGPCQAIDSSEGSLRIRLDDREKSVGTCGAPPIVDQLMAEVESTARVWRWVVFDPDELRLKIGHGWHVSEDMPRLMDEAIDWDAVEIIRILLQNGADVNADRGAFLMRAVNRDRVEATKGLLEMGADWKIEDSDSEETPATAAGFHGPEIVRLFLDKGADPNAVSSADHTMLMNAVYLSNASTVKLLVESGADVNVRNKHGDRALSIAENRKKEYSVAAPETARSFQPIIDYLIRHGAAH